MVQHPGPPRSILDKLRSPGWAQWFGDPPVYCCLQADGAIALVDDDGYLLSHAEAGELLGAIRAYYAHVPAQAIAAANEGRAARQPAAEPPWEAHRRRPRQEREGHIYVLGGNNGQYKIGRTRYLMQRVAFHQEALPERELQLIHYVWVADAVWAERYLHLRFGHCEVRREWFALAPEEVAWIMRLPQF